MRLIIPDNICSDKGFAEWLVQQIKREIVLSYNENKLEVISEYLSENMDIDIDIFDASMRILNTISILRGNKITQIVIPNKILYRGTPLTALSLAKLIDVGNIELKGTHVFSAVFSKIRNNLKKYYTKYTLENGGI